MMHLVFDLAATRRGENKEEKEGAKLKIKIMLLRLIVSRREDDFLLERKKNRDKAVSRWERDAAKVRVL